MCLIWFIIKLSTKHITVAINLFSMGGGGGAMVVGG